MYQKDFPCLAEIIMKSLVTGELVVFLRDSTEQVSLSLHLKTEADPFVETVFSI
jgi:hypothetical protein